MYQLKVITASTRPGRKGPVIADWIVNILKEYKELNVQLLDLAEINLPFMDEAEHPILQRYQHDHTKKWSATINEGDAFVIVTPEYDHGYIAPLKNALDFLYREWNYKPVAMVNYGGVAAGTRSAEALKPVLTSFKMMPIVESVNIPFFQRYINEQEVFTGDEGLEQSAHAMIKELLRWTEALKPMRLPAVAKKSTAAHLNEEAA